MDVKIKFEDCSILSTLQVLLDGQSIVPAPDDRGMCLGVFSIKLVMNCKDKPVTRLSFGLEGRESTGKKYEQFIYEEATLTL